MGAEGRQVVEADFNASLNVPRILDVMKRVAHAHRIRESRVPVVSHLWSTFARRILIDIYK